MASAQKRKRSGAASQPTTSDTRSQAKRQKIWEARSIQTQSSHHALNEKKELDVASFVKSHEFEIRALEESISTSKTALSRRAFQQVPRQLRRRTASHNVKRVPKRLRARAAREMNEDNTAAVTSRSRDPTGKQRLRSAIAKLKNRRGPQKAASPPPAGNEPRPSIATEGGGAPILVKKFHKRQQNKSWLPTHMFHAKRAQMTPPSKPLWRFAIPLTPTEKCYRPTHRASTLRGCVAWDVSYHSSVQLSGQEHNMLKLLRAMSVPEAQLTGQPAVRWKRGLRSWSGWIHKGHDRKLPIAPITIIWSPSEADVDTRHMIFRFHPSGFEQVWQETVRLAKLQRPPILVRDLRFELGSIEVVGPGSTESIIRTLRPDNPNSCTFKSWSSLATITDIDTLPSRAVLGFSTKEPRLQPSSHGSISASTQVEEEEFLGMLSDWPPPEEQKPFSLLEVEARRHSCEHMLSQKTINRRISQMDPDQPPSELPTDPVIPVILYITEHGPGSRPYNSWTILLPWQYVQPTWYQMMRVPLSSGGQVRFGGLKEQMQMHFEQGTPWYPGDFPGTAAGWEWEKDQREQRKTAWEKRPKTKRIQWETLDLGGPTKGETGCGWACDWEFLSHRELGNNIGAPSKTKAEASPELNRKPPNEEATVLMPEIAQYVGPSARLPSSLSTPDMLVAVSVQFAHRGHASECARIYRLPTNDAHLRAAWLALSRTQWHATPTSAARELPLSDAAALDSMGQLPIPAVGEEHYPRVPTATDLIGFVTAGNYNLNAGRTTAIGSIVIARALEDASTQPQTGKLTGLCIVRNAGTTVGRIARWVACH